LKKTRQKIKKSQQKTSNFMYHKKPTKDKKANRRLQISCSDTSLILHRRLTNNSIVPSPIAKGKGLKEGNDKTAAADATHTLQAAAAMNGQDRVHGLPRGCKFGHPTA
jgi:hypothetical protein